MWVITENQTIRIKKISILAGSLDVLMELGGTVAFFTDRVETNANATAGTVDLSLVESWEDVANFNPGDKADLNYTINNDENRVLSFNPNDKNLLKRFNEGMEMLNKDFEEIKGFVDSKGDTFDEEMNASVEVLDMFENKLRDMLNYVFNADVYDVVFNGANPLSTSGGKLIVENFLDGIGDLLKSEIDKENKKAMDNIKKYQKAYKKW